MVIATRAFPWDHFLDEGNRKAVEGFRRVQWPNIVRELGKAPYNCPLPEGLEPCWVYPGYAIYWQEQISRVTVVKVDEESGREYRVLEDSNQGFQPTGPLPANNPSQIARYLNKGFLLRPPGQVVVEVEDPAPDEASAQKRVFTCFRHGSDRKAFPVWKSYVRHCEFYKEPLEETPPQEILDKASKFAFYCFVHDRGFMHATGAGRHRAAELKKPGRGSHPSLNDMRMAKEDTNG